MKKAFYYCWYGSHRHWSDGVVGTPQLGMYNSSSKDVINTHIQIAKQYKIGEFCVSWWGINSYEDNILMNHLIKAFRLENMKISILFETSRYFFSKTDQQDLSERSIHLIVSEVIYLADHFKYQRNTTLDFFIYLSRSIKNINKLMRQLNDLKIKFPFIRYIGDEVYWFHPSNENLERYRLFDAISLYNPHISNNKILQDFWPNTTIMYDNWIDYCMQHKLNFIPTILPGYNDSQVRPEAQHPSIQRNIMEMYKLEKHLLNKKIIDYYLCSFNEWHEGTQIES